MKTHRPFAGFARYLTRALCSCRAMPGAVITVAYLCCAPGAFAQTTNYDFNLEISANGSVYTLALQPDGRILVGSARPVRLLPSGARDSSFDPQLVTGMALPGACYTMGVQDDGKILLGGSFRSAGGQPHTNLARFNADGALDAGFNLQVKDGPVFALATDCRGRVLIGGDFASVGGVPRPKLFRMTAGDGVDPLFAPAAAGVLFSLAVQGDERILVGGEFNSLAGHSQTNLGRLTAEGDFDPSFATSALTSMVQCFAGQANGKILAGTSVRTSEGMLTNLVRFHPNGSPDTDFRPAVSSAVYSIAVQADGKIIIGGHFQSVQGQARGGLARLNPDGSLDTSFVPRPYYTVTALALQKDGKLLIGGKLVDEPAKTNTYIGRLQNTEAATESLAYDGSNISWLRGGTAPELWSASFQCSADGAVWTDLGQGLRIPGGWKLTDAIVMPGSLIRARGRVSAGQYNGPSWFVESTIQVPAEPRMLTGNGNFGFSSGQFGFDYVAPAGSRVVVESSPDLSTWTPQCTNQVQSIPLRFSNPATPAKSFYRLRLL